MSLNLRHRILLTLAPLLLLLAVQGVAGVILLSQLGNSTREILRENYDSVLAMQRLNESLERIDSSHQIALSGTYDEDLLAKARRQARDNWVIFDESLKFEQGNITLPSEAELVAELEVRSTEYRRRAEEFYALPENDPGRKEAYYGRPDAPGLYQFFGEIKEIKEEILRLNQNKMEESSNEARRRARQSLFWFAAGMVIAIVLAGISARYTIRTILAPLESVTRAALGISEGNLDQVVPYAGRDELGRLAQSFNTMAHHLRAFRQSQSVQLLRAQQTIQATIDAFPDAVLVIDFNGEVEMANPAARRLLGVVPLQKGLAAAGIWEPPEPLREPLADSLRGQRDYLPEGFDRAIVLGAGAKECIVLPRILTIRDPRGQALGAAVLLQDVTRFRLLDQVKSDLVATASHELKTPLTSIRLAVHLLLEEVVGPLTPKQLELLIDARENSERLLSMVNNLLDLARLEQGKQQLNLQPLSPLAILQGVADAVRPRADDKGVEIVLEVLPETPPAIVDAPRLSHALHNLLDNALTYTDRGGKITLAASADPNFVTLSVADTGVGIPPDHLPHVFEKFFRVPGQSRGGGTGLGLAIVHEIVAAHGGTITCDSHEGVGTKFSIRLPASTKNSSEEYVFGTVQEVRT